MIKRFLVSLSLLIALTGSAHASLKGDVTSSVACGNDASSTSITVAAATSNRPYRVYGVYLAADVADEVTVGMGSGKQFGIFLGDNSGIVHNLYPFYIEGDDNTAISITKSASTDLHYCVFYTLEW